MRATLAAAVLLLSGCATPGTTTPTTSPSPSPTSKAPAEAAPPPPKGACYRLDYAAATAPTTSAKPVSCRKRHTSVTIKVGRFDAVVDGHLLAVDAPAIQKQIAAACTQALPRWVGGTPADLRLSRLEVVWFSPTVADNAAGARWFRCDLVAPADQSTLARLPKGKGRGLLTNGPGEFALCATGDPAKPDTQFVICSMKHSWRAISATELPKDAKYLDKAAGGPAAEDCKSTAADRAGDPLDYSWSFQWPTKAAWRTGERYALCWLPTSG